jgi:hypothetical protein
MSEPVDFVEVLRKAFNFLCQKETRSGVRMRELFEQYAHSEPVEFVLSTYDQSADDAEFVAKIVACQTVCTTGDFDSNELASMCFCETSYAAKRLIRRIFANIVTLTKDKDYIGDITSYNKDMSIEFMTSSRSRNWVYCVRAAPDNLRGSGVKTKITTTMLLNATYIGNSLSSQIIYPALKLQLAKIMVFSGGEDTESGWITDSMRRIQADRDASVTLTSMKNKRDVADEGAVEKKLKTKE